MGSSGSWPDRILTRLKVCAAQLLAYPAQVEEYSFFERVGDVCQMCVCVCVGVFRPQLVKSARCSKVCVGDVVRGAWMVTKGSELWMRCGWMCVGILGWKFAGERNRVASMSLWATLRPPVTTSTASQKCVNSCGGPQAVSRARPRARHLHTLQNECVTQYTYILSLAMTQTCTCSCKNECTTP
jgi:hypothetical protein